MQLLEAGKFQICKVGQQTGDPGKLCFNGSEDSLQAEFPLSGKQGDKFRRCQCFVLFCFLPHKTFNGLDEAHSYYGG